MTEITRANRFPIESLYDETPYTKDPAQTSLDTATWWTLHLRCDGELTEVHWVIDRLHERAFGAGHIGGDQWLQWAEPCPPDDPDEMRALHVLFRAPSLRVALMRARNACRGIGTPYTLGTHVHLSTAADWSVGVDVWPLPGR